jgi:hypothetical protein
MVGANVGEGANVNWEDAARRAGVPQDKIDQLKRATTPENVGAQARDPQNQQAVIDAAREGGLIAVWATFAGTLLSIGAAILGGLAGMGPTFRLFPRMTVV